MAFITKHRDRAINFIEDESKEMYEIDKETSYTAGEIKYILYDKKHCSWHIERVLMDTPL